MCLRKRSLLVRAGCVSDLKAIQCNSTGGSVKNGTGRVAAILLAEVISIAFDARLVESCKRIVAVCEERYHGDPVSARALRSWSGTKAASCGSGSDNMILRTVVAAVAFVAFKTHALGISRRC